MLNPAEVRAAYVLAKFGDSHPSPDPIKQLDTARSMAIADAYEALPAYDREALPAYERLILELGWQFQAMLDAGYKVEFFTGEGEPYANSKEMRADVWDNRHLYIFSTANGFGAEFEPHYHVSWAGPVPVVDEPNPLLIPTRFDDANGVPMLANDVFRAVHDFFGHAVHGYQFGPVGEDNAYREHASMFSELAVRALTTETRGQNSWVNFGPHLRVNGRVPAKGEAGWVSPTVRPFAEQKIALLPLGFCACWKEFKQESWGY